MRQLTENNVCLEIIFNSSYAGWLIDCYEMQSFLYWLQIPIFIIRSEMWKSKPAKIVKESQNYFKPELTHSKMFLRLTLFFKKWHVHRFISGISQVAMSLSAYTWQTYVHAQKCRLILMDGHYDSLQYVCAEIRRKFVI